MALRLTKPFQPLTVENARALPGQLGIYELADAEGRTRQQAGGGGQRPRRGVLAQVGQLPSTDRVLHFLRAGGVCLDMPQALDGIGDVGAEWNPQHADLV